MGWLKLGQLLNPGPMKRKEIKQLVKVLNPLRNSRIQRKVKVKHPSSLIGLSFKK